jgi:hypothetical protein
MKTCLQIRKTAAQNAKTALAMKSGMQISAGRPLPLPWKEIYLRWLENKSLLDQNILRGIKSLLRQCAVSRQGAAVSFCPRCLLRPPEAAFADKSAFIRGKGLGFFLGWS